MDPSTFIRLAVDPARLAVLGHAATGDADDATIAEGLGIAVREVLVARGKLHAAGLLDEAGRLRADVLRDVAAALPAAPPPSAELIDGSWTRDEAEVLTRFFSGSRLVEIPGIRAKRLIVLERLAQEFEPGVRYPEKQVNFMLQLFHPDYAALRRYLVDEEFMTRAEGVYWRSGGRYRTQAGVDR